MAVSKQTGPVAEPAAGEPASVTALEAAYGAPSQAGFGSAVFYERISAGDDLAKAALAKYKYFTGELWERWGEDAWMGPWKEVYTRPTGAKVDILAELRGIADPDARSSVPMILDNVDDADGARYTGPYMRWHMGCRGFRDHGGSWAHPVVVEVAEDEGPIDADCGAEMLQRPTQNGAIGVFICIGRHQRPGTGHQREGMSHLPADQLVLRTDEGWVRPSQGSRSFLGQGYALPAGRTRSRNHARIDPVSFSSSVIRMTAGSLHVKPAATRVQPSHTRASTRLRGTTQEDASRLFFQLPVDRQTKR